MLVWRATLEGLEISILLMGSADGYVNILWHNLKDSVRKLGLSSKFILQQDSDPKRNQENEEERRAAQ